jgi:hypothetical protein
VLIGKIEVEVSGMFGGADVDCPFGAVELGPCFKQVERRPDLRCARGLPGRLVARNRLLRIGQVSRWPSMMISAKAVPVAV